MKLTTIGTVIATRILELPRGRRVVVKIGKPRKFRGDDNYFCPFEIHGLGKHKIFYQGGVDSVQALELAMKIIGTFLYVSDEAKAGNLTWFGDRNLGFPVPNSVSDLIPKSGISRHTPRRRSSRRIAKRG